VVLPIGITNVAGALITTVITVALSLWMLKRVAMARSLTKGSFLLQVIATNKGYASLSQFQIMIWTLAIGASALYVIALSGNLIDIDSNVLILLGLTGVAVVGSKVQSNQDDLKGAVNQGAAMPPVAGAPAAAAPPPIVPAAGATPSRTPKWSDLIVVDGAGVEIDVTRVQMFFFTIVSALFVLIKVFGSYAIPPIPTGFLLLMGISNGVYLSKKFLN
jgi:hypothetical protein